LRPKLRNRLPPGSPSTSLITPLPLEIPVPDRRRRFPLAATLLLTALIAACSGGGGTAGAGGALRVSGSTTVNPVAVDAAEALRKQGRKITVDASGGSAGGITQLADGQVEVAMSSKPIADSDTAAHPGVSFQSTQIGADAVGVIVRREVFDGGVKSLDKAQVTALFEGRIASWKELGGPDLAVFVYDKEPGRGTREVLDKYLYGTAKAPPPPDTDRFAIVGGNEETRTKLLSTPGSTGPLSTSFITGHPKLAVVAIDGVEPSGENVRTAAYPMSRPLFLITDGPAAGPAKELIDFVVGPEGQKLVTRHGYLTLDELGLR